MRYSRRLPAVFLIFAAILSACAPSGGSSARLQAERERVEGLLAQVREGDSRRDVERVLGRPYSVESQDGETVMTYVTGPELAALDAAESQRAQANMQTFSTILGALGSYGGESLGSAGSIGTQLAGAGSSLGSTEAAPPSSEQSKVEVRLRRGKVVSVERIDSGRIGIGAQ